MHDCYELMNCYELHKAKHLTVFSKLLPKNKAAVNIALSDVNTFLQKTFKEIASCYILFRQRNLIKSKGQAGTYSHSKPTHKKHDLVL